MKMENRLFWAVMLFSALIFSRCSDSDGGDDSDAGPDAADVQFDFGGWDTATDGPEYDFGGSDGAIDAGSDSGGQTVPNVTVFNSTPGNRQIALVWSLPATAQVVGVKIIRKDGSFPTSVSDGFPVYNGGGNFVKDPGLTNGQIYYYKAFTYDANLHYGSGVEKSDTPLGGTWNGHIYTIDTAAAERRGLGSHLAINSHNTLYVSYFKDLVSDPTKIYLMYGTLANASIWNGAVWQAHDPIDSVHKEYWSTAIGITSADRVYITYSDFVGGNLQLKYATQEAGEVQFSLHTPAMDSYGFSNIAFFLDGHHHSLAIDSADQVHISYYMREIDMGMNPGFYRFSKYMVYDGDTQKTIADIENSHNKNYSVGSYSSIATDRDNFPHMTYYYENSMDLRYAFHNGTAWTWELISSANNIGSCSAIAIDSDNRVHIVYYDATDKDVIYLRRTIGETSWTQQNVDMEGAVGTHLAMVVDSSNFVHVVYRDETYKSLRYANNVEGEWKKTYIDQTADGAGVGFFNSIVVDQNNYLHVSYWYNGSSNQNGLKYAAFVP